MSETFEVPIFLSEAEEAEWWFENREAAGCHLARAVGNGTAQSVRDLLGDYGLRLKGFREIAVPIVEEDVELARKLATGKETSYRELMGKLLHKALERAAASS